MGFLLQMVGEIATSLEVIKTNSTEVERGQTTLKVRGFLKPEALEDSWGPTAASVLMQCESPMEGTELPGTPQ